MESLSESKQPAVQGQGQVQGQKQPTLESHLGIQYDMMVSLPKVIIYII
jgi:hypothetical protein